MDTEGSPREVLLPKVTSRGEREFAPRHSQLNTTNSRLLVGEADYQDVNEGPTIRSEAAIERSRPARAITAKVVNFLAATDIRDARVAGN